MKLLTTARLGLAGLVLFQVPSVFSQDNTCERNYGLTVAACAQSLDFLALNVRARARKACVQDAKLAKAACASPDDDGGSVTVCEVTYDPAVNCTPDNLACKQIVTQRRSDCLSAAVLAPTLRSSD